MKWFWLAIVTVLFGFFVLITTPVDESVWEAYNGQTYSSKSNFVSKKNFEVRMKTIQQGTNSSDPVTNTGSWSQSNANAQESTGTAQGLWSNSSGVTLSPEEFADVCRSVVGDADSYIALFGMSPESAGYNETKAQDSWKDRFSDGVGLIHYMQGGMPWSGLRHKFEHPGHNSGIGGSGCGSTAMSIIFSTMLHKYITPAEIAAAVGTYNKRYGTSLWFHTPFSSAGAMDQSSKLELIFADQKYNGQSILNCDHDPGLLNKDKIDACLDAGGMVMWVSSGSKNSGPYWASDTGHWVVIRERTSDGRYLNADGANKQSDYDGKPCAPDTANEFDVLYHAQTSGTSYPKNNVFYITPGPGYQDYINSLH